MTNEYKESLFKTISKIKDTSIKGKIKNKLLKYWNILKLENLLDTQEKEQEKFTLFHTDLHILTLKKKIKLYFLISIIKTSNSFVFQIS